MWPKKAKKKRDVFINGFTTWGVIQLSMKLSWHIQAPENNFWGRIGHIYRLLRFADGKYRQATVATIVPLRRFRKFLRKKWLAAVQANWNTNLEESRGIPARDFRCQWLTPLFARQISSTSILFISEWYYTWSKYNLMQFKSSYYVHLWTWITSFVLFHVLNIYRLFNTVINFLMKYFLSILEKTIEQINKKTYLHHDSIQFVLAASHYGLYPPLLQAQSQNVRNQYISVYKSTI